MDYRKSWEDAEAEMLQTQRINRQYGTRSGVTKPATSEKTDTKSTKKNTKQTNSAATNKGGTHSARGKTSNSRQNRSDSESRQGIHKNGSSWYNPDGFTQTDTWLRDIRRRMGVSEDSGIAKTNFAGSSSSSKSNASSAAAKSSVKHASDFTNYVNDTIKSTAKNSTEPSPLDFGRYGAVGKEAKTLTNDLAARIALLKPEDRPTPDEMDFMSGMMSGDKHFVQQNEALKRSFWNASGAPKAPDFPVWKNTSTQSNPPSDPAEIQVLKKVEQKAKELLPPPRETNPKRDLEAELALRRRLAPIDPTTMDPSVVDSIYQDLDTIAYLDDPNNRKILIQGEGYALAPSAETDNLSIEDKNALFAARKAFPDVPGGVSGSELELLGDSFGGVFTDEQLVEIQAGADPFRFVTDLDPEQQEKLVDVSYKIANSMSNEALKDALFLSSGILHGLPRDQRKLVLAYMKNYGGTITPQSLVNLGIYRQDEVNQGYVAGFIDDLTLEYALTRNGTSLARLHYADMQNRSLQLGAFIATGLGAATENRLLGTSTKFFGNGRFDQLDQSTGAVDPTKIYPSVDEDFKQDNKTSATSQTAPLSNANPFHLKPTHSTTLSKKAFSSLLEDIKENGIINPIKYVKYNGEMYVVDGHHRLLAAKKLGMKTVPIEEVTLPYQGYQTIDDLLWFD